MQTRQLDRISETTDTTWASNRSSCLLRLAEARPRRRKVRYTFSPRREECLTRRAMLAALRDAEFQEWMNSGGDFLDSLCQPVH